MKKTLLLLSSVLYCGGGGCGGRKDCDIDDSQRTFVNTFENLEQKLCAFLPDADIRGIVEEGGDAERCTLAENVYNAIVEDCKFLNITEIEILVNKVCNDHMYMKNIINKTGEKIFGDNRVLEMLDKIQMMKFCIWTVCVWDRHTLSSNPGFGIWCSMLLIYHQHAELLCEKFKNIFEIN